MLSVKCGGPFTRYSPSDPRTVRSGADGAILSREEKLLRLGQSSRGPNPAPTRLLRRADYELVFPGPPASGLTRFRRSPPSADVGSRTRSSSSRRAALSGCCVAFPSSLAPRSSSGQSSGARISRRPALLLRRALFARPASSVSRQSVGGPRPASAQAQRPELAPSLRANSLRRRGHREWSVGLGGPRAGERARPRGDRGRSWRREDGRQAADPYG